MSDVIRFRVSGIPKAMSVGKSVRVPIKGKPDSWQHFQTRTNTDWSVLVGQVARAHAPAALLDEPTIFAAIFYLPRPQSLPRRGPALPIKRPDLDNLVHKLTDRLNGVFWKDDSVVTDIFLRKRYALGGWTGVEITVAPITAIQLLAELDQMALDLEGRTSA